MARMSGLTSRDKKSRENPACWCRGEKCSLHALGGPACTIHTACMPVLCMYVCLYVCMSACTYECLDVCMSVYVCELVSRLSSGR